MINLRYHLVSLAAVFLALGIGMLIGNSFVGLASVEAQTQVLEQLKSQVASVGDRVEVIQRENALLQKRMEDRDRALRAIAPRVVPGLLAGRNVAIVVVGRPEHPENGSDLAGILSAAGATVVSTTRIDREWLTPRTDLRTRILAKLGVPQGDDDLIRATWILAKGIAQGNRSNSLKEVDLVARGLEMNGDYSTAVGAAVLISAANDSADALTAQSSSSVERALIETWQSIGLRVAAAEPETTAASLISFFRSLGAPTIDNIDTVAGQMACAAVLAEGDGHYGVKPTADRLLPESFTLPSNREAPIAIRNGVSNE